MKYYNKYNGHRNITRLSAFEVLVYSPTYSCLPPPMFILLLSVIQASFHRATSPESNLSAQVGFYIWHIWQKVHISSSYLIYDPSRRHEAWRFLGYQFVHAGTEHIVFNMLMQLMVGVPLELSQRGWLGKLRLLTLYMAGVLLGSVASTITSPEDFLCGASAGVYALIAAHLATLIINWKEDGAVFRRRNGKRHVSLSMNPLLR